MWCGKICVFLIAAAILLYSSEGSRIEGSIEAPGLQKSTVKATGRETETFDNISEGNHATWTSRLGSTTLNFENLWIKRTDETGGAGRTGRYAEINGDHNGLNMLNMTIGSPVSYVSFFANRIEMMVFEAYDQDGILLAKLDYADFVYLMDGDASYWGNPSYNKETDRLMDYLKFNVYATTGEAVISKITIKVHPGHSTKVDNVEVGMYEGPQASQRLPPP